MFISPGKLSSRRKASCNRVALPFTPFSPASRHCVSCPAPWPRWITELEEFNILSSFPIATPVFTGSRLNTEYFLPLCFDNYKDGSQIIVEKTDELQQIKMRLSMQWFDGLTHWNFGTQTTGERSKEKAVEKMKTRFDWIRFVNKTLLSVKQSRKKNVLENLFKIRRST